MHGRGRRALGGITLIFVLAACGGGASGTPTPAGDSRPASTMAAPTTDTSQLGTASGTVPPTSTSDTMFRTSGFLPGMRVTAPPGWFLGEDDPVEFKIYPPGSDPSQDPAGIRFWVDPHASTPCTDKDLDVPMATPRQIVSWLGHNKNIRLSSLRQVTIAGQIAATQVDLDVRRTAPRCAPECPGPCIDYLLFHAAGRTAPFGTGPGESARFYFARIGPPDHVLVVNVFADDRKTFTNLTADVRDVLASLALPDQLPA